jgi:hypothetical protein
MSGIGMRFGYYTYKRGSMAIHGSSIDEFLMPSGDGGWLPKVADVDESWQPTANMIASNLETIYLLLLATTSLVWQIEEQPPSPA